MERVDDCEEFCQVVDLFSFSRIAVKSDLRQSLITFNRFIRIYNFTSSINSGLLSTELMPKLVAILWARFFWVRCKYKSLQDIHMCNLKWMIASRNKSLSKSILALLHILIVVTQKVR